MNAPRLVTVTNISASGVAVTGAGTVSGRGRLNLDALQPGLVLPVEVAGTDLRMQRLRFYGLDSVTKDRLGRALERLDTKAA